MKKQQLDNHLVEYRLISCRIQPAAQSDIGEQQWVTGFCWEWSVVGWLIVYQDGDYLYLGQYSQTFIDLRLDDTAFGVGAFSWQDPVHSWKAGPAEVMALKNLFI